MNQSSFLKNQFPVGLFCHSTGSKQFLDGECAIDYQGLIVAEDGDTVLILVFDWITGEGDLIVPVPKKVLYDTGPADVLWTLYPDEASMKAAYEAYDSRHRGQAPFDPESDD